MAAPTVATMASYTTMQFVDGLIVSRIGPEPGYIAAQGNANVWSFVPISIVMGLVGVTNTYVSQNLGAGRPERAPAYAWNALWITLLAAIALVPYGFAIPALFARMGHSPLVTGLETRYAQITIFGAALTMCTRSIAHYFYGMHRPAVVFVAALTGNIVNFFASVTLVYGSGGASEGLVGMLGPAGEPVLGAIAQAAAFVARTLGIEGLGVPGSAFGTLVGSAVELSIPVALFLGPRYNRLYRTRAAWRPSLAHMRDIWRLGWPPALMFGNEIVCWAVFMAWLVGKFGTDHNAAGWIVLRYMHLSFMPAVGISFAVTALVGRCMGAGRPDLAGQRARLGLGLTMVYMGTCALAFVLLPRTLMGLFLDEGLTVEHAAAIQKIGVQVFAVAAVFQLFDAMGITLIGALRGAGDTVWPGVVTIVLAWTCIIGGGMALVEFAPGLGSVGPWAAAGLYIVLLGLFLVVRFAGGKWKSMRVLAGSAGASIAEAAGPVDGLLPMEVDPPIVEQGAP